MNWWKRVYWTVFTSCGDASSFAILFSSPHTCRTAGSLVVKALWPSNFQTWGGTSRASLAAGTCSSPTFYCSSCSSRRWRTRMGGGGDGAVSGSCFAAVAASTTGSGDCSCRRTTGRCSCHGPDRVPSTFPCHSPSMDIATAAAGCSCSWTISDCLALRADATADGFWVATLAAASSE